uniref:Uncharacterized protein n=1 Tax=Anopheles atroparvus TaxID=41427 RepID=A0AAG5D8H1_ANOAO
FLEDLRWREIRHGSELPRPRSEEQKQNRQNHGKKKANGTTQKDEQPISPRTLSEQA